MVLSLFRRAAVYSITPCWGPRMPFETPLSSGAPLLCWYAVDCLPIHTHILKQTFLTLSLSVSLSMFKQALTYITGTFYISLFQVLMSDDAAWCRGFRSGSKLISSATSFDLCSAVLQFILYFHLVYNYSQNTWIQFTQGGTEWLLGAFARLLHCISAFSYGTGCKC